MVKKGLLGAALAAITLVMFSGVASAQYGGPDVVPVVQGESISVTGDGCAAGATVTFTITSGSYSSDVGTTVANDDGTYTTTITVPADTPPGSATATATCEGPNGETVTKVLGLEVSAAAAAPVASGALPRTGSDNTQTLVGVGAGFLLLGGTLAIGARRTRRTVTA